MKNTQKQGHFENAIHNSVIRKFITISKCNADIATRIADILTAQIHLL